MKKLVIFGAGGCGRETADLVGRINQNAKVPVYDFLGFIVDVEYLCDTNINGKPVWEDIGKVADLYGNDLYGVIAVADPEIRKEMSDRFSGKVIWENLIDPRAVVSPSAIIGEGNIIQSFVYISSNTKIGSHCLFNINDVIGHDAVIEDFVSIMSGCCVTGHDRIEEGVYMGTGVNVIPSKTICSRSFICAGSTVLHDINVRGTYAGMPARLTKGR